MSIQLSVILPCYNVPNLLDNLLEVIEVVQNITNDYEIILVDDGSDTFPYITQNDYVKVITFEKNKGKGVALIAGFKEARGEIICFIDADLQIPAKLLKSYYKIMNGSRNPDILIGSKRHYNSQVNYPFIRRLMSFGIQTVNRLLFGFVILDTQSGLKFFKRNVIKDILPYLHTNGFAIDLEILSLAQKRGYKILECPIQIRQSFNSTIKIIDIIKMFYNVLGIWYRKKIGVYKLKRSRLKTVYIFTKEVE